MFCWQTPNLYFPAMKPIIAISCGDPNGIGPEVILKTLSESGADDTTSLLLGDENLYTFYRDSCDLSVDYNVINSIQEIVHSRINLLDISNGKAFNPKPGKISKDAGKYAMLSVETGIELCLQDRADALVTAPISKEAISLAGFSVPGHTEFLAEKTGTDQVLMVLVSGSLRVALATVHVPLRDVPDLITVNLVKQRIEQFADSLTTDFSIKNPAIAVLGLNPHAGDGGIIGKEEFEQITPAIHAFRESNSGITVNGPFPADSFFGKRMHDLYDGILAMYHDQGLGPFKTLSFGNGVNMTAGLPIIRTSPDHGTAFDISGKNMADHRSFAEAFKLAKELSRKKKMRLPL